MPVRRVKQDITDPSWASNVGHAPKALPISPVTVGVPELFKVISEEAPDAIKAGEIKNHFGRKVAIVSHKKWE